MVKKAHQLVSICFSTFGYLDEVRLAIRAVTSLVEMDMYANNARIVDAPIFQHEMQ